MSTTIREERRLDIDLPQLEKSLRSVRTLFSSGMSILTAVMTFVAVVPLFSALYMLIRRGIEHFNLDLFTELPPAAGMAGGGVGNALVGTLVMIGIAAALSVPFGILAAVYLAEFSRPAQAPRPYPRPSAGASAPWPSPPAWAFSACWGTATSSRPPSAPRRPPGSCWCRST